MASKLGPSTGSPSSDNGADTVDLASVLAALERDRTPAEDPDCAGRASRRGMLTLILVGLLIGGVIELATSSPDRARDAASGQTRAETVFSNAKTGSCLNWPVDEPDKPSFVYCADDHMFEVAKPVDMASFGEPCQLAVRNYLSDRYDPSSRFTIGVIWPGDAVETPADGRSLLCGLQLLGPGGRPTPFKGKIAELDQSRVWPVGTCVGIDDATKRSTDVPVDCTAPHALEVTGAVNLAEHFPEGLPAEPEQQEFLAESCARAADAYLAPRTLETAELSVGYDTVSPASWAAGSRQSSCGVGIRRDGGWAPLTGSLRAPSPADLPAPAPPATPSSSSSEEPAPLQNTATVEAPPPAPVVTPAPPSSDVATTPPSAAPTTTATSPPPSGPPPGPPPSGPPPGPPPSAVPSESTEPPPGVIELPGMAPITLPWMAPPPPAPPA